MNSNDLGNQATWRVVDGRKVLVKLREFNPAELLSPEEMQEILPNHLARIYPLLLTSLSKKEIAVLVGCQYSTLKVYISRLYGRLRANDRYQIMAREITRLQKGIEACPTRK